MNKKIEERRGSKLLTIDGETHTIYEWSAMYDLVYTTVVRRIERGVPQESWFEPQLKRGPKSKLRKTGNPDGLPYRWNDTAKNCYKIGCMCDYCDCVPEYFKKQCKMKEQVKKLVLQYGAPKEVTNGN